MGYLKEKYTREYFLGTNDVDKSEKRSVAGFDSFRKGQIDQRYVPFLRHLPVKGKSVLDIGCGRGEIVNFCAQQGARQVTGIDFSPNAIEITRELTQGLENIELIEIEAVDMDFQDRFDVVFALDVVEHIPDAEMQQVYDRVYEALRPGGIFIVHTPIFEPGHFEQDTDHIPEVSGMHCNKQTKESLEGDLKKHGFEKYSLWVWHRKGEKRLGWFIYSNRDAFCEKLGWSMRHPLKAAKKILNWLITGDKDGRKK